MDVSMSGPEPTAPDDPTDAAAGQISFSRFGARGSRIAAQPDTSLPLQLTASLPTRALRTPDNPPFEQVDMSDWEDLPLTECLRGDEAEMLQFALDRSCWGCDGRIPS